jgi:hypothetical protein
LTCAAAVELLIGHGSWLVRNDFLVHVELCRGFDGEWRWSTGGGLDGA